MERVDQSACEKSISKSCSIGVLHLYMFLMLLSRYNRIVHRSLHRLKLAMATPYNIVLGPQDLGNFHSGPYNPVTAAKVSELLQRNLESFDILFLGARHSKCLAILARNNSRCRTLALIAVDQIISFTSC
jgi:hypothetical protein